MTGSAHARRPGLRTFLAVMAGMGLARADERAHVFEAAAFGAVGDGVTDDRAALQSVLDAAAHAPGPALVRLDPGRSYRLGPHGASIAALSLVGATNVALEGNGATLLAHPSGRVLTVYGSENIVLRNLCLDYSPLPYTQGRILEVFDGGVSFSPDPGYPAPIVAGADRYQDHKSSDCVFLDGETRKFNHEWRRVRAVESSEPNACRILFHGAEPGRLAATRAGDYVAVKILQPQATLPRDADGRYIATGSGSIQIRFSNRVRLEGITSYASPDMTLVAHGAEDVSAEGLRIMRKPGTDRLVAGCSDGAHMKSLTRMPRFHDCRFEALMDDSINIKVSAHEVVGIDGAAVRMTHRDIVWDDLVLKPGDEIEFMNAAETVFLGRARVIGVRREAYRQACITLDRVPAALLPGGHAYLRPELPAIVSNCVFLSQLKTAVLTRPQTRIENCRFEDVAYGVHAMHGDGIEGPVPRGIDIRRCVFIHPQIAGVALHVEDFAAAPPDAPGVRVADCDFTLHGTGRAVSGRIRELELTGNAVRGDDEGRKDTWIQVKTSPPT